MPRDFSRTRRVGKQLRRDLAELVRDEITEPGLGLLSISDVRVSPDLSHARIYVSILQDDPEVINCTMDVLRDYSSSLRSRLGKRMHIRTVPRLEFIYDDLIRKGSGLNSVIESAVQQDHLKAAQYGTDTEENR